MKSKTLIILAVIVFLVIVLSWIAAANSKPIVHMDYRVSEGDTLWEIAEEYTSEEVDIRETIYKIQKMNNLETAEIYPGDIILIPCGE